MGSAATLATLITCLLWSIGESSEFPGDAPGAPKPQKWKSLNLFHAGEDSLSWDNLDLVRMRTLHTKDFNNAEEFLGSANLAEYLGLLPVESLHLPVPVNVVLLGFAGDGNAGVNVTLAELNEWFAHVDHVLPHSRIDRSELTCQEDGQCAGLVHGRFHPTPLPSHVHLNFSCNVVLVRRRNVVDAFERAIAAFSRPVDPALATGMQQVDAAKLESFVDHFVGALGLQLSYSLLLLNPTWHAEEPVYGFRLGMSGQELQLLRGQTERLRKVMLSASKLREPELPPLSSFLEGRSAPRHAWPYGNVVAPKFSAKDATWDSDKWVAAVTSYLAQEERHRRQLLTAAGGERGAAAVVAAARLLARPGSLMGSILRTDLLESWAEAADALHSTFHTAHPAEDCLVNTWVASGGAGGGAGGHDSGSHDGGSGGGGRWVLLDLTAGGKDWGPALGGEGVVTAQTLPNVHELFGGVRRIKEEARQAAQQAPGGAAEVAVSESLAQARSARLPSVANRHHHMYLLKKHARRYGSGAPGSAPPGPPDPAAEEEEERAWRVQHQMVLLQAELDVLEEWAVRHCHNQPHPPMACGSWREEAVALRAGLAKLHGAAGAEAAYELFRGHKWEIFGQEPEDWKEHHSALYDEEELSRDTLLGELAGALSRALRHVIAPPTATWQPLQGQLHGQEKGQQGQHGQQGQGKGQGSSAGIDPEAAGEGLDGAEGGGGGGAAAGRQQQPPLFTRTPPFAYQVHFHIHLISDSSRQRRGGSSSSAAAAFDVAAYQAAVEALRMRNQAFTYSVNRLALHEQPALAAGLAAATRTTLQEVPSTEDFFDAEMERVYVDSSELAAALRTLFPPTSQQQGRHGRGQQQADSAREQLLTLTTPMREVPVFVFQLERDVAVLLDAHYNARSLQDMILVVANSARRDEHPTGMMCGGQLVARPTSPLKEALAATLLHLGGVLPPHLGRHPRTRSLAHDWLWSVGGHPLSLTSTGLHYTPLQRDALARSYLLDALDLSVAAVNGAVGRLARVRPSAKMYAHLKEHQSSAREVLRRFGSVVSYWRSAVASAYGLDLASALEYVRQLEGELRGLVAAAEQLADTSEPVRCASQLVARGALLAGLVWAGSGAVALGALLWAAAPRLFVRKAKAS